MAQPTVTPPMSDVSHAPGEVRDHEALASRLDDRHRRQLAAQLVALEHEFAGHLDAAHVVEASDEVLEHLMAAARFTDFIPVLTYRYTRELLRDEENQLAV